MSQDTEKISEEKDPGENATVTEPAADAAEEKPEDSNASSAAADAADSSEEKISRSVVNNLYREMKRWKEKCRQAEARANSEKKRRRESEAEADRVRGIISGVRVDESLRGAAEKHGAIDPAQIAEFLHGQVTLDEQLEPIVTAKNGSPRLDPDGEPFTLDALVHEFLSEYPHHAKAREAGGAGSTGSNGTPPDLMTRIRSAGSEAELKRLIAEK
ncbi:MAG: hypothetical protein E3J72_08070 [Planctomycetota bacterium]|nr:MAG: hypothetical protein E3J72_08070 [Planctomycetota bacterium]